MNDTDIVVVDGVIVSFGAIKHFVDEEDCELDNKEDIKTYNQTK
jgi:hypothetical protein